MRNLTKTLAVVSLLAPAGAHPLGIGDIKLHSALNQNLNAEIPLVVSAGENAADIKVNLAPPDKFDEAGVPWSYFLSKIKFEPVVGPNGSVVIKLSSREALKEPVLDLLLEVSWPKGNLYREFTVLVDPPAAYSQATIPVSTRVESYESYEPEQDVIPQRQQAPRPQARPQRTAGIDKGYVVVNRNDSLWNIAKRVNNHRDVSMEQMMLAIYQQNPAAFYKQNVNALIAGKKLKIPEKEAILKLSRKDASAEFNRQKEAWKNRADVPANVEKAVPAEKPAPVEKAAAVEKPTSVSAETAKETTGDNHLKLIAPTESTVTENVAIAAKSDQPTADKPTADAQQTKVDTAAAPATGTNGAGVADAAGQQKLTELENQLAETQRLLALKDEQLSSLQNQPANPVAQQQPAQPPAAVEPAEPAAQLSPEPKPVVHPEPESDNYYLTVGGVGAGVLSLLGWLWWRKRKIDEEMNAESMFASSSWNRTETSENLSVPIVDDSMSYNVGTVGESSFLSEFTPSDFGAFDTDQNEIDPISEADVYLAYGRYQQAEELMRHAIKEQPDRDECKLKLLEIFYSNENKQAFEAYAGELATAGKKDEPDFWAKVVEMGSEICPDSELFSSGPVSNESAIVEEIRHADVTEAHKDDAVESADVGEMDFEMFEFETSPAQDTTEPEGKASNSDMMAFDVSSDQEAAEYKDAVLDFDMTAFEVEDDHGNNGSLDFDLNLLAQDSIDAESVVESTEDAREQEIESFDFDFKSNETEAKEDGEFELITLDDNDATLDFQDFDFTADNSADADKDAHDDFEFNFDLDMPVSEGKGGESYVSGLTDMDEWETKLDLAKAYIDMGDAEAARDIADEVYEKGSSEQRKVALELLDELK
ncbi:FimV/HubP family polar landmark protein [Methylobacter sp. YRD-M1]|uniref:FimV/HubP family polar landmark protein n=1 Tax=Methylobacter sp. YRD-M1 TaxID=2911520 RepID=UPI00227C0DDD|nr:FimV/HubP family polar landmark protein [Methylobacter sp. YRD-M1]WAK02987.1 fimbrial protein FimV [Methylobacter sp. YRD-M1]